MPAHAARSLFAPAAFLLCVLAGTGVSSAQVINLSNALLTGDRRPTLYQIPDPTLVPIMESFTGSRIGVDGALYTIFPNEEWTTFLPGDSTAVWMGTIPNAGRITSPSAMIAIPFDVGIRRGTAQLNLVFAVDDQLGSSTSPGIWYGPDGQSPTSLPNSNGIGNFTGPTTYTATLPHVAPGRNYLYLLLHNAGGGGGIMFGGTVTVSRLPGEIVLDTDTFQVTNDGDPSASQIKGVPFTTVLVGGIAEFRVQGDINLASNEVISVTGSRPARLIIGGNLDMAAGSSIDASAINTFVFAGGGAARGSVSGGLGTPSGESVPAPATVGVFGSGGLFFSSGGGGSPGYSEQITETFAGSASTMGSSGGLGFGSATNTLAEGGASHEGTPGIVTVFDRLIGPGGAGGSGGASGGNGGDAPPAPNGHGGFNGAQGTPGVSGNPGRVTIGITTLAAGSGGGSGAGGGGGTSGGNGCQGGLGGGGGGGGGGSLHGGGPGGFGGLAVLGGRGGDGGRGGESGRGGGGGGILDVIVLGKVTGSGSLLATGGNGLRGIPGDPGADGGPGGPGGVGLPGRDTGDLSTGGNGGRGGHGGTSGHGGTGGYGGRGGGGGAGAGGCVRLFASVMQSFSGDLNTVGGRDGSGNAAPAPSNGAVHFAFNAWTPRVFQGNVFEHQSTEAPRAANPVLGTTRTPYIPDLADGPAPFGFLANVTAAQFFPNRPAGACMGFQRLAAPPSGLPVVPGFDYCVVANLSATNLLTPTLGVGTSAVALPRGGRTIDPLLGSAFATIPVLPPGSVWTTLVPSGTSPQTQMNCTLGSVAGASSPGASIFVLVPPSTRIFVDMSAPAGGNGTSWATAYSDLQSGLAFATALSALGSGGEISVGAGLYRPDRGPTQTLGNVNWQFLIPAGFTIRGGYAGRNSGTPDFVNASTFRTVLSGDLGSNDDPGILLADGSLIGNPPPSLGGNHSFTVSLWMRYQSAALRQWVLDFGTRGAGARDFHMLIEPNGTCTPGFYAAWGNAFSLAGHENQWIHLASVYDASTRTLTTYLNGRQVDSDSNGIAPNLVLNTGLFRIASPDPGEQPMIGRMRSLRVWATTRTAAQIVDDMCTPGTTAGTDPGLVAYYPMDAIVGNTVADLAAADGFSPLTIGGQVLLSPADRTDNSLRIVNAILAPSTQAAISSLELRSASISAITVASGGTLAVDDLRINSCIDTDNFLSVIEISTLSRLIATDLIVSGNTAPSSSIVNARGAGASASFDRCVFSGNTSAAAVIRSSGLPLTLSNSALSNNVSSFLPVMQNAAASNCTLVNNTGASIMVGGSAFNCIFSGNSAIGAGVDVRFSLLQTAYPTGGPGNVVAAPHFVNLAGGDFRLIPGSIGVDIGLSSLVAPGASLDLAGNPRILDDPATSDVGADCPTVDMGAYEAAGIIPIAPTVTLQHAPIQVDAPALIQLTAAVSGGNVTPIFRWTRNGITLANGPSAGGGVISGATTPALTITGAGPDDSGNYVLFTRASCRLLTTSAVSVLVNPPPPVCLADFNHDDFVNPDDLADFITCFFLDVQFPGFCPDADFNADGFRDPDDLADFITTFFLTVGAGGC